MVKKVALGAGSHQLFLRFNNGQKNVCSVSIHYITTAPTAVPAPTFPCLVAAAPSNASPVPTSATNSNLFRIKMYHE
jgi:hypothetical protein